MSKPAFNFWWALGCVCCAMLAFAVITANTQLFFVFVMATGVCIRIAYKYCPYDEGEYP